MVQGIADGIGQARFLREFSSSVDQPGMEFIEDEFGLFPPFELDIGGLSAN